VEDCITLLVPIAKRRNITLSAQGPAVQIEADRNHFLRLMTNLIGNAIPYNRDGGSVKIGVSREDEMAVVKVTDTGSGIPQGDQPRIFQRFFRADKSRNGGTGGSGLGLAICKSITAAHGGDISFTSVPGAGTTFIVRLPTVRPNAEALLSNKLAAKNE
jgi:signal transduction histidine kinase